MICKITNKECQYSFKNKNNITTCSNKSCNYYKEHYADIRRKHNKYEIFEKDGYVIGYTNKNEKFMFDLEDYDKVVKYTWYLDNEGYIRTNTFNYDTNKRSYIFLHNLVLNTLPNREFYIDHIGGNQTHFDNRKSNLRIVTISENNINQKTRKDNTSGYKGINYNGKKDRWIVRIQKDYKRIYVGGFKNLDDAIIARKNAEKEYHDGFIYDECQEKYKNNIEKERE